MSRAHSLDVGCRIRLWALGFLVFGEVFRVEDVSWGRQDPGCVWGFRIRCRGRGMSVE